MIVMLESKKDRENYFTHFLREFKAGLRIDDQQFVNKLVKDLVAISMEIPPQNKQYSFREIIMLMALINQKKLMTK